MIPSSILCRHARYVAGYFLKKLIAFSSSALGFLAFSISNHTQSFLCRIDVVKIPVIHSPPLKAAKSNPLLGRSAPLPVDNHPKYLVDLGIFS
jgi:hypothetical protein